jgi:hypothetical protein
MLPTKVYGKLLQTSGASKIAIRMYGNLTTKRTKKTSKGMKGLRMHLEEGTIIQNNTALKDFEVRFV